MDPTPTGVPAGRAAAVRGFLARFTATTAQLVRFFPGRTLPTRLRTANRWLRRQRARRRVRLVGTVQRRETGRPEHAYGRRCPPDEIEHEVRVTDFALLYPDAPAWRGDAVGTARPDLTIELRGWRCYVEVDNSQKMTARQMADKWRRYGPLPADAFILVVCRTAARMERLRAGAGPVKDWALFTTFDRLRAGLPWSDASGDTVVV